MESQYESQPQAYGGANDAPPPAPPFVLEATRGLAVNHIERYQNAFSRVSRTQNSDSSAPVAHSRGYSTTDEDVRVRQSLVKGKLTRDLNELLGSVSALEETLVTKRIRVWISQGFFAVGLHVILRSSLVTQFAHWVAFAYFPVALYKVWLFEKSISRTTRAREAFERILNSVQKERRLRQTDTNYVTSTEWDTVPWKEFAGSIYFSH